MNRHHTLSLNEWIQTQLSLYFALSILSPQETGLDRWLLCLAHKFFPTLVPDLITRLNQNDLNLGKQLLLQHCQSLDAIRDLHPTPNLAVIGSMPSFVCMQLDFIHMKLFTATVLHDMNDLSHRTDQNHIWLDRVKTWLNQGQAILHSIENQTNVDTDHVASLEQLSSELSETVRRHLRAPLMSLDQHRYRQRRSKSMRRLQSLQHEFQLAYDKVVSSIRRHDDLAQVSTRVETAIEAYQRWSGAAPAANIGLYSAMQKQYCEFRTRVQQVETQKSHVDAFVQYTDTLLQEARQLDTVDILTLEAFKDRVHIATERMAARIPYPAHETLKNAKILDLVRHRKRALWEMQELLESKLLKNGQQLDQQLNVWIDMRMEALQDSINVAAMPGLSMHDVQLLQKDCRAFRATHRRSDVLDPLIDQLERDLDQRERQVKLDFALQQLSTTIDTKTHAIWDIVMPLEEGHFSKKSFLSLDDATYDCELETLVDHPQYPWIQQKHHDFVQLIAYAKELVAQRDACALYQTQANNLQTQGKQYRHALERAWENMSITMTSSLWDTYVNETDVFLTNVRQLRLECPKNVKANRPKPCLNMFASWLSDQCVTLLQLSSSVSLLTQRHRLALEFKSEIDAYLANIAAADNDLEHWTEMAQDINARIANSCCSVMTFDAVGVLTSLAQRIEQRCQADEQRALDSAAAKARASWTATVAAFDTAAASSKEWSTLEPTLQILYESSETAFKQLMDSTLDDEQEQRRLADMMVSVRTALKEQNVMAGYAERCAAWQSHMDVALRLCDQHEATIRQFIQDVRSFVVTQPLDPIHVEVPDISHLETYVEQHSIRGFEKFLTAQWTLEERVGELGVQLDFANNVSVQCGKIQDIIQMLEQDDTDGVAKRIQDPELYPARSQDDHEYNAMIRKRLHLLLDEALERRQEHEQSRKQSELEGQCQAIVDHFKAQADTLEYTQMDALLVAGQDSIRRLDQLGARAEYAETIESTLTSIDQAWKQQLSMSKETEKQRQDQQALDAYQQVHDWLAQQHNDIQIFNDSNIQEHRALLQDLERKGIDVLLVQLHAERRRHNVHLGTMETMYQRVKADQDDLLAAIDYVDELNSKKRQMESTQSRVDGLLSAMRVMVTWALKSQDEWGVVKGEAIQAHCAALDTMEAKASKAIDVFRAQVQGDKDLEQQYRETHAVLNETLDVVQAARPWCSVHLLFDSIESMVESKSASALRAVLDDAEQQIMAHSESDSKTHAVRRHERLTEMVDAVEQAEEAARRRAAEMEARKAAERRRLSIEHAVQAAYKDCLATAAAIANDDGLHDFYLSSISTVSVHQARRIKWMDPRLNEAVCTLESVYTCLESVCHDARQADEIQSWIKTWKGQDLSTMAATIETYLASDPEEVPVPQVIKDAVQDAAQRRRASVKAAWTALYEQVKQDKATEAQQMKEQQEREQLATVERLISRARIQLRQCQWNLDKRDLASMPREPEALAVERRVTDLAATTASLLREHYPQTTSKNVDRTTVDMAIRDFFDDVQDTQCQIAQALAISEYLMISDDIHMMLSIFEESIPTHPCMSKQDLQAIEAQQKYYDEQVGQKLDTAQVIAHDNPILHKPYKQLCERWASVQRQVQVLLRRQQRITRGRLTSLPTLTASTSGPSPLASASSPLSPRPSKKKRNNYEPDPENQLDVEIGRIVNQAPYSVKVEMVPGEVGRYWFGSRLVYCRILKSRMVMVRVGGGWTELSQFLRDHALLRDNSEIQVVNDEQGFIQMRSTRRPSLPPPLYNSSSSSTISSSSTTSSGYYMDGDRYMAVDQHGNYHTLKMTKVDHLLSSSGSRSILIK
ncbi:hypothetical protein BJV82DRAFT_286783 [Fennellomyces sp. T-0311]|nr:hypothetical protein BJV82DRAFT_286783 [Fennellomyces sp. T-0311]